MVQSYGSKQMSSGSAKVSLNHQVETGACTFVGDELYSI